MSGDWPVQLTLQASEEWRAVYLTEGFDPVDGANRVRALSRSNYLVFAHISDEEGPIAAGTASFSHGWVGIHGLRTVSRLRNKGCARAIIAKLGEVATTRGMDQCYLQVEETNAPAISLYCRLGFLSTWRYHYWRKQT
jgi:ribosomal protein S18 acetylase RimI-like enzyme